MNKLARYHLIWGIALLVVTLTSAIIAVHAWFVQGRPPVYKFWGEQMIIVAGAYLTWARVKAFRATWKK